MTRHGRNATASSVYSYHEKKKDTHEGAYGSRHMRLSKDSIKDFDCCCLSLQPCKDPVITRQGYVYDKEAILEYMVHQKGEIARKLKEFEKQKNKQENELKELAEAERRSNAAKFVKQELSITSKDPFKRTTGGAGAAEAATAAVASTSSGGSGGSGSNSVSNMVDGKGKRLPSFWIPGLTPDNKPAAPIAKPDKNVYCPMSGEVLKMKDLTSFRFTPVADSDDKRSEIVKDARYMCAVSHDILTNCVPCVVLKTSGNVVTMECYTTIISKDMMDPINGQTLKETDVIPIKGGTGFAASGAELAAVHATAVMS